MLIACGFGFGLDAVHLAIDLVIFVREPRVVAVISLQPRQQIAVALENLSELIGRVLG